MVEVNAEGVICLSAKLYWFLTDPVDNISGISVDVEWGRGSYGSADEI